MNKEIISLNIFKITMNKPTDSAVMANHNYEDAMGPMIDKRNNALS